MLTLVIGGAASGKSAYAESLTLKFPLPRYYVATMQVWDEECAKRVEKHRAMRKEKQFETIESPISLDKIRIPNRGIVLLEDLGNLTANELYDPKGAGVNTAEAILYGVEILYKQFKQRSGLVASFLEAWIEITKDYVEPVMNYVASFLEAWIEIMCR